MWILHGFSIEVAIKHLHSPPALPSLALAHAVAMPLLASQTETEELSEETEVSIYGGSQVAQNEGFTRENPNLKWMRTRGSPMEPPNQLDDVSFSCIKN